MSFKVLLNCPDTESGSDCFVPALKNKMKGENYMDESMFGLLLAIENLTDEELKYVNVWIEYNLQKREVPSIPSRKG